MKRTIARTLLAVGAVAMAALAAPVSASAAGVPAVSSLGADLTPIVETVNPVTDGLGLSMGEHGHSGGFQNGDGDWGSTYGDVTLYDKQNGIINSNGAPLVNVDLRCVDAMGGIGGYANAVFGNNAKCNSDSVMQYHDGGILG